MHLIYEHKRGSTNEKDAGINDAQTILRVWAQNSKIGVLSFHQAPFDAFYVQV